MIIKKMSKQQKRLEVLKRLNKIKIEVYRNDTAKKKRKKK
jgi:hypothetical protein